MVIIVVIIIIVSILGSNVFAVSKAWVLIYSFGSQRPYKVMNTSFIINTQNLYEANYMRSVSVS